jgi:hypothetical protein
LPPASSVQNKHDLARRHGRSFRGLAMYFIRGERITMIPVISVHGLLSFELFQAPQPSEHLPRGVNAEHFKAGPATASPLPLDCQPSLHCGTSAAGPATASPLPLDCQPRGTGAAGPATASPLPLDCQPSLHCGTSAAGPATASPLPPPRRPLSTCHGVPSPARLPAVTVSSLGLSNVRKFSLNVTGVGPWFKGFAQRCIVPHLRPYPQPHSVVVMDRASIHFRPDIIELIERRGARVFPCAPHCPWVGWVLCRPRRCPDHPRLPIFSNGRVTACYELDLVGVLRQQTSLDIINLTCADFRHRTTLQSSSTRGSRRGSGATWYGPTRSARGGRSPRRSRTSLLDIASTSSRTLGTRCLFC